MTSQDPPPPTADASIDRPSPIDPLLAGRPAPHRADPPAPPSGRGGRTPRRAHPARGARAIALAASVASTAGLASWIALTEGAFDTDETATSGGGANLPGVDPGLIGETASATTSSDAEGAEAGGQATATTADDSTLDERTTSIPTTTEAPADDSVDEVAGDVADDQAPDGPLLPDVSFTDDVLATAPPDQYADGSFLGTAEYTEWGDVQVEVTIESGVIVDVVAVQMPDGRRSTRINDGATPILEAEAIAIQSADLDIVSGATYTSITYADSLQAALDDAALAAAAEGVASA